MHLEYKTDHTYFFAFTATAFLNLYLKFVNTFETFDWLTKITHIADRGVYLKRPKRLLDISIFAFIPLK